jgi:glutamate dehydrogenase (NADP+)
MSTLTLHPTTTDPKATEAIEAFMNEIIRKNPGETEFHQAVFEVANDVIPYTLKNPKYAKAKILERIAEPDRTVIFRVTWEDDKGNVQVNRGYRIQFNNAIGPYKGGLRFHPSVTLGTFKFLGFEQIFKNSLTTLPMGGAKGGSDFDPKGKSDHEIMRFCHSFMMELSRHIGADTDVPAGDIGVGAREVSYMFGQYKRIENRFTGVLTGKGIEFGGSLIRKEATGYGCVYFVNNMLATRGDSVKGKTCLVSGSGNVAQFTVEKLLQLGAKVLTLSDSAGTIYDKNGITQEKLDWVKGLKSTPSARIKEYVAKWGGEYLEGQRPWHIPCDLAFPSATQNELTEDDAKTLVKNGVIAVGEGANMPSTPEAIAVFLGAKVLFGPGKAANAGGVSISGIEMAQNSMRYSWTSEEVEAKLKQIMAAIHEKCVEFGTEPDGYINYVKGANVAGFVKVANAMLAYGIL